jgi:CRP/FNR family transcriptional regulator, nitrogen oxide reductase regulator
MRSQTWDDIPEPYNGESSTTAHSTNDEDHAPAKDRHPRLFSGISSDEYGRICRAGHVKQLARGEMLFIEGDVVERVLLLTSGTVKITKLGPGGEEVILRLAVPGDVLGAINLFSSCRQCATAEVFRPCRALVWDAQVFENLMKSFPILHQNMVVILNGHLRELEDRFYEVATGRVGPRVALQLLRLLKSIGRPVNGEVEIGLSREDLAQMTGTTLFTVSRLLSAWEARGAVRPCREAVAIRDVPSLRAISTEE